MRAVVEIREPDKQPRRLALEPGALEVGRECSGLVVADPAVSRRHIVLVVGPGGLIVTDLALELVDKLGGGSFSFDDVELATLLAGIAAAALMLSPSAPPAAPGPDELGGELRALAAADPTRYATTATLVASLLARD